MYGIMFTPRPGVVATELLRVTKPGGRIALANWTPTGFIGQLFDVFKRHVPPPPGLPSPMLWSAEDVVRQRLAAGTREIRFARRIAHLRFPFAPAGTVEFFRQYYGPTQRAFASLSPESRAALRADLDNHQSRHNVSTRSDETDNPAEYLEVCARRAHVPALAPAADETVGRAMALAEDFGC